MFIPSINKFEDVGEIVAFMQRYSFATIITTKDGVPFATHLPFIITRVDDKVILKSHLAKANPQSADIIARAAKIMNEQIPNSSFYIDGFTDNVGNKARNRRLSKARAQAVVNQLVKDGVAKNRLVARGFGEQYPKAPNNTEQGRAENRRVEVSIRNVNQSEQKNSIKVK